MNQNYFRDLTPLALQYATRMHAGQKRKYTGEDYINHPIHVAGIIGSIFPGCSYTFILGLLHDTLEDTDATFEEIQTHFGGMIVNGVFALTKIEYPGMNRSEKLAAYGAKLSDAWLEVQVAKAADIASNVSSISIHDPKFGVTYCKEKFVELEALTKLPSSIRDFTFTAIEKALYDSERGLVQLALQKKEPL